MHARTVKSGEGLWSETSGEVKQCGRRRAVDHVGAIFADVDYRLHTFCRQKSDLNLQFHIETEGLNLIFEMYGHDARKPRPSLIKSTTLFCDTHWESAVPCELLCQQQHIL